MIISARENSWKLYLDDIRNPRDGGDWVIARSVAQAKELIQQKGMPSYISFDHDIDLEASGMDLAKWIIDQDLDGAYKLPEDFAYFIHSANPQGAANIKGILDSYMKFKKEHQ